MPPAPGEAAFVLVGGPLLPAGQLPLLREAFTIGVALGGVPFAPSMTFEGPPAGAARWAMAQACRPVCLIGANLAGPDAADLLDLLAGGNVWLWNYRGRTFERMVEKMRRQ
ncbi:MAG: hypothetical protein NTV86_13045 [Planctomycetota bacterium]|nr:hypothetical protein [Planctomycetota bacterium]